jgi:predicted permease
VAALYGNAVQLGIPMAAALFGEAGLALHVALVSLHGVVLLTLMTVLAEVDLARADRHATLGSTVRSALRNALIHPVILPVLLGLAWNLTGLGLHPVVDDALALLASAVVPLCLVLIGTSLAQYGLKGRIRGALTLSVLKLAALPALVFCVARFGFGLHGMPLGVVVMMAALPTGSNALIFAERYDTGQAEATAAIVVSTLAFVATASVWLSVLAWVA